MPIAPLPCPRCRTPLSAERLDQSGTILCPTCNIPLTIQDANPTTLAWYISRDDQEKAGPFSWVQLRQLAGQRMLEPADRIWRNGMTDWTAAGALGLFAASQPSPRPTAVRDTGVASAADSTKFPGRPAASPEGSNPPAGETARRQSSTVSTLDDFEILRKLGAGGMGVVYLARQRSNDRQIALKVLSRALASQTDYVKRFYREAAVLSRLHHPNIVEFAGVGEDKGLHYFAMEFIDGFSLAALLERRGGRLAVCDALYIALAAARALAYAHERNVIHRDVKPANIMVSRLGHIKLTDLGLARPLDEDLALTNNGASIGTPHYMAPEQAHNAELADARSDVYGLGGVLYHMLTGEVPFSGESVVSVMLAKERGVFTSARHRNHTVPDRLDLIIDKMLAKDLRYRSQNCFEAVRDLESLGLAGEHLSFNPLHTVGPA
jgi:uncharacterized protein YbaR (Trm112 family)